MKERLHSILFKVIPSCREAMELQSRSLDGELGFGRRALLRMHLLMCRMCRRYGSQIHSVNKFAGELPERAEFDRDNPMPGDVRSRIRESITEGDGE